MKSRVYVTGATGFVGRHVCQVLIATGHIVTAIVRTGSAARLPTGVATVIEIDDLFGQPAEWWADVFEPGAYVVHLAWTATPGVYINDPANLACLAGTLTMAQGGIDAGVRKFTGVGTCIEYRMGNDPLDIDTPLDPRSPYAGAKAAAYLALSTALEMTAVDFSWCRIFGLFGEGEHPNRLIANLHTRLSKGLSVELSDGLQVRDFLDVRDGALRIVAASLGPTTGSVNICSGIGMSVRDKALEIAAQYGRKDLLNFGARPNNVFDPDIIVGVPTKMLEEVSL